LYALWIFLFEHRAESGFTNDLSAQGFRGYLGNGCVDETNPIEVATSAPRNELFLAQTALG